MAKHRAWRVRIENTNGRNCMNAATISFHEKPWGVDLVQGSGGTPVFHDQSYDLAAKAFDNNTATLWHDSCGFDGNGWIGWDFGGDPAVWQDVRGFGYLPRPDNLVTDDSMRSGGLEYSDDLIVWHRLFDCTETTSWTVGDMHYFWGAVDEMQEAGGYRYVKVEGTAAVAGQNYTGFSGLEILNAAGTNIARNVNDSVNPYRTLYNPGQQYGNIQQVTRGGNGLLQWNTNGNGTYCILDFGAENKIIPAKIRMYPNRDDAARTWSSIRTSVSNDGLTWVTVNDWTPSAWVSGQWQENTITSVPDGTAVHGPHRYWRVFNIISGNPFALGGLAFTDENRVEFTGATITASSYYGGGYEPQNLLDSNPNTPWAASSNATGEWLALDYGTPIDPTYLKLTARGDNSPQQAPSEFLIQYSDDGTRWITMSRIDGFAGWSGAEVRHFDIYFDSYKLGLSGVQGGGFRDRYASLADIRWLDETGEQYDTPPYNAATMPYAYGMSRSYYNNSNPVGLYDGLPSNDNGDNGAYIYGNTADDRFIITRFPTGTKLAGLRAWSRNNSNAFTAQSPVRFRVARSTDNGLTYRSVGTGEYGNFTAEYQMQEALFAPLVAPAKRDRYRLRATELWGSNYCSIVEVEWRAVAGGPSVATGGTVLEVGTLSPTYAGANAYDGSKAGSDNGWVGVAANASIGYRWENETYIAEYAVYGRTIAQDQLPRSWVVEYSEDQGLSWVIVDRRYNVPQSTFQDGVPAVFTFVPNTTPTAERHRYWRLLFDSRNQYIGMSRLSLFDENGVDLSPVCALTNQGALSVAEGTILYLLSDNPNDFVYRANNVVTSLEFDFLDNPRDVQSYAIKSRYGYSNNDCPRNWYLQWSDDNTTWTSVSRIDGQEGYTDNTVRTYKRDFVAWRLMFTAAGASGYLAMDEVEFHTTIGGPSVLDSTQQSNLWRIAGKPIDNGYFLNRLADGAKDAFWYVDANRFDAGDPPTFGWRFDDDIEIVEVKIWPRHDGYQNNDSPSEFTIQKSIDNGLTWQARGYVLNLYPWNDASPKTISVPETVVGFARVGRVGMYMAEGGVEGVQAGRLGMYIAEGPDKMIQIGRVGMYIVEGPETEEEDDGKLYRPRQFFIN